MAKGKYEEWLRPNNLLLLQGWARKGLTDEQIAHNIGISRSTFSEWKRKYPDISDTVQKNKDVVDFEVENALFKSAIGHVVPLKKKRLLLNKATGKKELTIVEETEQYIPPSNVAQIFWLKNRKAKEWREHQEVEVNIDALNRAAEILGGIESVIDD